MLVALNTPEWKRLFAHPDLKKLYVSRRDIVAFVGKLNVPDHETYSGCRMLCANGYLAIFVLDGQLFLLVHANCDRSPIGDKPIAEIHTGVTNIIRELTPADRRRLGIQTVTHKKVT